MDSCIINFFETHIYCDEIENKDVIEIGSRFINGTVRYTVEQLKPKSYIGIDILDGPCVDIVCSVDDACAKFGINSFDVVISCEMLEHVLDFRTIINTMKMLCRPGGIIALSTRSKGFGFHGYPFDFWRFEIDDIKNLFKEFQIIALEKDTSCPGVILKAKKINNDIINIDDYMLYNIIYDKIMPCDVKILQKHLDTVMSNYKLINSQDYFNAYTDLLDKGARKNTDKVIHGYLPKYELFLKQFINDKFNLLELGIYKGSSLMMWYDYFKNANIIGVDISKSCKRFETDRISVEILDLGNINSYTKLHQNTYKVIIDDASHFVEHQLFSLFNLFSSLEHGGIYIIEDLHTNFEPLIKKYKKFSNISTSDILLDISESVLSNYAEGRIQSQYSIYVEAISREIDMISFIQKSCIIVKK